jgi:membrane fusion protein (multidrug efflux system)
MRVLLAAGGAVVVIIVLTSPRLRPLLSGPGSGNAPGSRDSRLPVTAVVVTPESVSNLVLSSGTVRANEEVELRSEATGLVLRISFAEGTRVRKGEVLVKIDDSELRAQRAKQDSQRKVAREKERRRKQLFDKQNISPEDYELALNELNAINAEIELIEARIAKTEIRAPFDGLIGLRYVSEGSYVTPDVRIASLQNIRKVKVDFAIPEKYSGSVRKGQQIHFRVSGLAGRNSGEIFAIEPKIDPVTRSVLIRAVSPNVGERIMPGGFAEVELELERIPDALMIPAQAIVPDLMGQKVYLYRAGLAEESRVDIGLRTEAKIQVVRGIRPGDTVLTSGLLQVVAGTPVRLAEAP